MGMGPGSSREKRTRCQIAAKPNLCSALHQPEPTLLFHTEICFHSLDVALASRLALDEAVEATLAESRLPR